MKTRYFQAVYSHLVREWSVREVPSLERVADFPTQESAEAFALALNDWLAAREVVLDEWLSAKPDPAVIHPFFTSPALDQMLLDGRTSEDRLHQIFDRMVVPELIADMVYAEHERRAAA